MSMTDDQQAHLHSELSDLAKSIRDAVEGRLGDDGWPRQTPTEVALQCLAEETMRTRFTLERIAAALEHANWLREPS